MGLRSDLKNVVWAVVMDGRTVKRGYIRKEAVEGLFRANSNGSRYFKEIFSLLSLSYGNAHSRSANKLSHSRTRHAAINWAAEVFWRIPNCFGIARLLGPSYSLRCVVFH